MLATSLRMFSEHYTRTRSAALSRTRRVRVTYPFEGHGLNRNSFSLSATATSNKRSAAAAAALQTTFNGSCPRSRQTQSAFGRSGERRRTGQEPAARDGFLNRRGVNESMKRASSRKPKGKPERERDTSGRGRRSVAISGRVARVANGKDVCRKWGKAKEGPKEIMAPPEFYNETVIFGRNKHE